MEKSIFYLLRKTKILIIVGLVYQFKLTVNFIIKKKFIKFLEKNGIETRPIISGNFLNQPSAKLYKLNKKNLKFPNADLIEKRGFFIGIHTRPIKTKSLNFLISNY